jgi:hypothetical protein
MHACCEASASLANAGGIDVVGVFVVGMTVGLTVGLTVGMTVGYADALEPSTLFAAFARCVAIFALRSSEA